MLKDKLTYKNDYKVNKIFTDLINEESNNKTELFLQLNDIKEKEENNIK
jgi:hypothetical protein